METKQLLWDLVTIVSALAFYLALWLAIPKDIRSKVKSTARELLAMVQATQEERSRRRTGSDGTRKTMGEALRRAKRQGCPLCDFPRVDKYKEADKWVAECQRCDFRGIGYESKSELQARLQHYNGD